MSELGHNSVARGQLRAFVGRIERLEEEKAFIAQDIREVYGEAKAAGFDVKALRAVIRLRKRDKQELAEHEALVDSYRHALGDLDGTPLGEAAIARDVGVRPIGNLAGEIVSDLSDPPFAVPPDEPAGT